MSFDLKEYYYHLPSHLIANRPCFPRDCCRLMYIDRLTKKIEHHHFYDLQKLLNPGDVLVLNQSQVFPARIFGQKITGGQVEVLLCQQTSQNSWLTLTRPGLKEGTEVNFSSYLSAKVLKKEPDGETLIQFNQNSPQIFSTLSRIGFTPIPPYIKPTDSEAKLRQKYQTVYAKEIGSAAAPTAGLHFTKKLLNDLKKRGIQIEYLTLHVGLGTFQPLRAKNIQTSRLHSENYEISPDVAKRLNLAKNKGSKIIAVGTTTVRALESSAQLINGKVKISSGLNSTDIFIYPPYKFKFVDSLITNFHLPESSLLMLVSAFASKDLILKSYNQAIENGYRFFSFGDAMLIA